MSTIEHYETTTKEYTNMLEMTTDIKAMGDAGWSVVAVNAVSLRAVYKKELP